MAPRTGQSPLLHLPPYLRTMNPESQPEKPVNRFSSRALFDIPPTPESAAVRIVRNLGIFGLYYAIFVWTVLFITLVPKRKVSLIFLVSMTEVTFLYFLLLRALPESVVLHKIIDKRAVVFLLFIITAVEIILTGAGIHLLLTLSGTIPIVMVHAVFKISEDFVVSEEGYTAGELTRLV